MAQNNENIHIGAARIFLGVTPPISGDPPTKLVHDNGVPETGVEVGYTQDAATFTYKQNKQEVVAEQSLNPVDVFNTDEVIQIEFNAMEHVYASLRTAFDNVGSVQDAEGMMFYGGDGAGLVNVTTQCVALTSRIRTAPTKFEVLTIYRVYNMEGVAIPYSRTGVALYKITLKGLTDPSREPGDRLFQWYREASIKATGATMGSPGTFTPAGADVPWSLGALGPVTASPLTLWTPGSHVVLGDNSKAFWNATAWVTGTATALVARGGQGQAPGGQVPGPNGGTTPGGIVSK